MKKLLGVLSVSLWAGALMFSPAPADAFYTMYPSNVEYFACSTYKSISLQTCSIYHEILGEEVTYSFTGMMMNTVPIGACSGSCNGSENLYVNLSPGNGRKDKLYAYGQCGIGYVLELTPCSSCG